MMGRGWCRAAQARMMFGEIKLMRKARASGGHVLAASWSWTCLTCVLLSAYLVAIVLTFQHYGITWDEDLQSTYGELIIRWYGSGFRDRGALDLWLSYVLWWFLRYNRTVGDPALAAWDFRDPPSSQCLVRPAGGRWRVQDRPVSGRTRRWISGSSFLVLTPAFYGHAFNNPKDIPFATLFVVALYYLVLSVSHFPVVPWTLTVKLGAAVGARPCSQNRRNPARGLSGTCILSLVDPASCSVRQRRRGCVRTRSVCQQMCCRLPCGPGSDAALVALGADKPACQSSQGAVDYEPFSL